MTRLAHRELLSCRRCSGLREGCKPIWRLARCGQYMPLPAGESFLIVSPGDRICHLDLPSGSVERERCCV